MDSELITVPQEWAKILAQIDEECPGLSEKEKSLEFGRRFCALIDQEIAERDRNFPRDDYLFI